MTMHEEENGALGLNLLYRADDKVRAEALDRDGHRKRKEVHEVVHVFVRLARLHPGEERDHERAEVLPEVRATHARLSTRPQHISAQKQDHSRRDMLDDGLEELEAPRIVELRRYQPLLHDSQDRGKLARRDHLRRIAGEERLEELHQAGDAALLLPRGGREQEREQAAVVRGHVGFVELEHLREDLEGVGDVLCVARVSGEREGGCWGWLTIDVLLDDDRERTEERLLEGR